MAARHTAAHRASRTTGISRRQWLRAAAAAVAATPLVSFARPSAAADESGLRAKAKQNIKLGVDGGPYSTLPLAEAVSRIKDQGFHGVLTGYAFADVRFDPLAPDWQAADKIVKAFQQQEIEIAASFGYMNVVDPVVERRQRGEARMACLIQNWKRLGCGNISTETGTFNTTSEWAEAPENFTDQGYQACRQALEKLALMAEKTGAVVSIEPYWKNVINSVERTAQLFHDIPSPGLRLVMDPCNYPRKEDLPKFRPLLEDVFRRLGDKIVVAHAKDVAPSAQRDDTDLPAAGRGVLDYPLYLGLLARLDRPIYLLVEHVELSDVPRARDYVLAAFDSL
jgi:sugar phosphate isomerase/epimerase